MLTLPIANPRDVLSLQRWTRGNACLSPEETEYLIRCDDLAAVAAIEDGTMTRAETCVENMLLGCSKDMRQVCDVSCAMVQVISKLPVG